MNVRFCLNCQFDQNVYANTRASKTVGNVHAVPDPNGPKKSRSRFQIERPTVICWVSILMLVSQTIIIDKLKYENLDP